MDREKVIKGLECCLGVNDCDIEPVEDCPYKGMCLCAMALRLDVLAMLKEQEAVKPVLDEQTGRMWLCGKCGSYVGFEDNDPHDPNEFDKYCRECGRPVLWEGR